MLGAILSKALRTEVGRAATTAATKAAIKAVKKHGPTVVKKAGTWAGNTSVANYRPSRDVGIVRAYLEALECTQPGVIEGLMERTSDPVEKLDMVQRQIDSNEGVEDRAKAREAFTRIAKRYSERNNISHQAWCEMGVPQDVLDASGIRNQD